MTDKPPFDPDFAAPTDWARMYRAAGLQVVPAMTPSGNRTQWKRPALSEWRALAHEVAPDPTFERWYGEQGEHARRNNMGMITGPCSGGAFMIDLDLHKNPAAAVWWEGLMAFYNIGGELETPRQTTGGGGKQILFRAPAGWMPPTCKTSIGVDIRGQGGFAMLPPSMHESGTPYKWDAGLEPWEAEIMEAPQWLCDEIDALVNQYGGGRSGGLPSPPSSGPVTRTATPASSLNAFGLMVDGREDYATKLVWARVVDEYRQCPIKPGPAEVDQMTEALFVIYERNVKSRLTDPTKSNEELLEREGRGKTMLRQKMHAAFAQWDGKVNLHAKASASENKANQRTFDEALAALHAAPDDKQARDDALSLYSQLGALEKTFAENKLSKVLLLPKMALRAAAKEIAATKNGPSDLTHSEIVDVILNEYASQSNVPVGNAGSLFFYDGIGIWKNMKLKDIEVFIGRKFASQKNAKRAGDYTGVARVLYNSVEDEEFFTGASPGICTTDGFWKVEGTEVVMVPHAKGNRARHKLKVEPDFSGKPTMFLGLLDDAFYDPDNPGNAAQQIRLLRQLMGATILGYQPRLQRAVFLYGAPGSGKSLFLRILETMFDPKDVTLVSPHELDQDYKKAMLAHKRLNIVPELSSEKPIPPAEFKAMLGQDRLSARLPYHPPFTLTCDAACWFNGNAMPVTRDHGEAFFRRWVIIYFRNSKPEALRDTGLFERIIDAELAKIAGWAIEGARDLLANGLAFSQPHHEQMKSWRQEASSVASWLADAASESGVMARGYAEGKEGTSTPIHRSKAYRLYKSWCLSVTRKPLGINAWRSEMEKLGHTPTKTSGDFVFHSLKEAERASDNAFGWG
jgi:hypothetical protein